jgi:hypothetical protein
LRHIFHFDHAFWGESGDLKIKGHVKIIGSAKSYVTGPAYVPPVCSVAVGKVHSFKEFFFWLIKEFVFVSFCEIAKNYLSFI